MTQKKNIIDEDQWIEFEELLYALDADNSYATGSSFSANKDVYPDNRIPFVNKHIEYLHKHPEIEPHQYLNNLKLMTRKINKQF